MKFNTDTTPVGYNDMKLDAPYRLIKPKGNPDTIYVRTTYGLLIFDSMNDMPLIGDPIEARLYVPTNEVASITIQFK